MPRNSLVTKLAVLVFLLSLALFVNPQKGFSQQCGTCVRTDEDIPACLDGNGYQCMPGDYGCYNLGPCTGVFH
jgi:hypothetical protein